jgi:Tol biopolymer transport system component
MKKVIVIFVCLLMIATVFGASMVVIAGKGGGGGKPPKDPPPPSDPAIAFTSTVELYVMNADGSALTNIYSADDYLYGPTWAPDKSAIGFLARVDGTWDYDLWRIDVDVVDGVVQGSNAVMLISDIWLHPVWSPNGDVIAFPSVYDGSSPSLLQTIPANGGTVETINTADEGYIIDYPTWSPDGSQIAFRERDTSTPYPYDHSIKVLTLATETEPATTETVFGPVDYSFSGLDWARTSDTIALMAQASIWTIDITQTDPTPQFIVGGEARWPTWSPDDSQMAFSKPDRISGGGRTRGWRVHVYDFATEESTKITGGSFPDWSRA